MWRKWAFSDLMADAYMRRRDSKRPDLLAMAASCDFVSKAMGSLSQVTEVSATCTQWHPRAFDFLLFVWFLWSADYKCAGFGAEVLQQACLVGCADGWPRLNGGSCFTSRPRVVLLDTVYDDVMAGPC